MEFFEKRKWQTGTLAGILVPVLLAGCAAPDIRSDETLSAVTPAAWSTDARIEAGVSPAEFWKAWHDETLERLISLVQTNSPSVESAMAALRSARAGIRSADAQLWPSVTGSAGASRTRAAGSSSNRFDGTLSGEWSINVAGAMYARYDEAILAARAKAWSLEAVKDQMKAQVATAYINLRAAEEKERLLEKMLESYRSTAQLARWKAEAGLVGQTDSEMAQVQVQSAIVRLNSIRESKAQYRNAIARLVALPNDRLDIPEKGEIPRPDAGFAVSIPAEVLMRRPDVRSALESLQAAAKGVQASQADFFPTLRLSGSLGTEAATIGALGASGTGVGMLAAALSSPILNWGSLRAAEETAQANFDQAKATYRQTLVEALEETDNALWAVKSSEMSASALEQSVLHARNAREISRLEYQSGLGDYTELLTAEREYLSAQESEIDNRAGTSNAYATLFRVLGGEWNTR